MRLFSLLACKIVVCVTDVEILGRRLSTVRLVFGECDSTNRIEITNKMRPCSRIYHSNLGYLVLFQSKHSCFLVFFNIS